MKNAAHYRWPCLLRDAQQTFTVQNKPAAVAQGNHHPSFLLRFWNWAKKTVDAIIICGGAESIVKTETQQNIRKWIARFFFITLGIYTPLEACVYCSQ